MQLYLSVNNVAFSHKGFHIRIPYRLEHLHSPCNVFCFNEHISLPAHVFFDDAMDLSDDDILVPNSFVAELIDCIDDAIR